jgi:chromosome segregation ATPase
MDLKAYQALKAQRRQLEAEFSKTPTDKIRSQLEEIAEKLKMIRPRSNTVRGRSVSLARL